MNVEINGYGILEGRRIKGKVGKVKRGWRKSWIEVEIPEVKRVWSTRALRMVQRLTSSTMRLDLSSGRSEAIMVEGPDGMMETGWALWDAHRTAIIRSLKDGRAVEDLAFAEWLAWREENVASRLGLKVGAQIEAERLRLCRFWGVSPGDDVWNGSGRTV